MLKGYLKITSRIIAWAVVVIFVCSVLIFGLLQTPFVKELIADRVTGMKTQGYTCSLQGLHGFLPFSLGFKKLSVRDEQKKVLLLQGFQLSWKPWKLLLGTMEVTQIHADKLEVGKIPEKSTTPVQEEKEKQPGFHLPAYMPARVVARVDFPSIILEKPVLGEKAEFSLSADLELETLDNIRAELSVLRTDRPGMDTSCKLDYSSGNLSLKYQFSGGTDGVLNRYTDSVLKSPLQVSLQGKGPIENWSGNIQIHSEQKEICSSDIVMGKSGETIKLDLKGKLNPARDKIVALKNLPYRFEQDISLSLGLETSNREVLHLSRLLVSTSHIKMSARGKANTRGDFNIDGNISVRDLEQIPEVKNIGFKGSLDCGTELKGNWKSKYLDSSLEIDLSKLKGMPQTVESALGKTLNLQSSLALSEENTLHFEKIRLKSKDLDVSAAGQLDLNSSFFNANWKMQEVALTDFLPELDSRMQGLLGANGHIKGTTQEFTSNSKLHLSGFSIASVQPVSVSVQTEIKQLPQFPEGKVEFNIQRSDRRISGNLGFSLSKQRLDLEEIYLDFPDGYLSARGFWSKGSPRGNIRMSAKLASLSWVQTFWPARIRGALNLNSTLKKGEDSRSLFSKVNIRDFVYSDISFQEVQSDVSLTDLSKLKGKFAVEADKIQIGDDSIKQFTLKGSKKGKSINLDLASRGNYGREFDLDLSAEYFYASKALKLVNGRGSYASMHFAWKDAINIDFGSQKISLRGKNIHLAQGKMNINFSMQKNKIQGEMSLNSLEISALPLRQVKTMQGSLDGDFSISGRASSPNISFSCEVPDLEPLAYINSADKSASISLQGEYKANNISLDLNIQRTGENILSGKFEIPIAFSLSPYRFEPKQGMQGELSSRLELEWVSEVMALQDQLLTGELDSNVHISGSLFDPIFSGDLILRQASYDNADSGTSLRDMHMHCELRQKELLLTEFSSHVGESGQISGEGSLKFAGEQGIEYIVSLNLSSANLYNTDLVSGNISGNLKIKGSGEKTSICGELNLFPLKLGIPEPGPKGLGDLKIVEVENRDREQTDKKSSGKKNKQKDVLSNIFLDLQINIPGGMYIRGRGVESEWKGDLRVKGNLADFAVNGKMQVLRGDMNILGKRFGLERGEVTFTDQSPPRPYFEILAVHSRSDLTVNLLLSGTPKDLSIDLSSEPNYPRDEILSRLLFGKELSQITPLQAVKLAWSIRQLTSGSSGIMGKVRNFLQVDMLQIKSAEQGEGTTVGVGKYLNENVYFEVEKGVQGETGRVTVSIELTRRFSLQSVYGSMNQGVTFNWEYQY